MKLMKKLALQQGQSPAIDLNSSMRSIADAGRLCWG